MKRLLMFCAASMLLLSPTLASADQITFSFSYHSINDNSVVASGLLTTKTITSQLDHYLVTAISGTRNGEAITGLRAPGTYNDVWVDNVIIIPPDPKYLSLTDHSGFAYTTSSGIYNPYYNVPGVNGAPGAYFEYVVGGNIPGIEIEFKVVPEPTSLAIAGLGTLALLGYARRQRRRRA